MKHRRLQVCGSTNDEARAYFLAGDALPILISVEEQTAGRGREGRSWSHHRSNFAGSLLVEASPTMLGAPGAVALLAGLAIRDALIASGAEAAGLALKWPNDVLRDDRKVAGVLAEMLTEGDRRAVIVGAGVNLAKPPQDARFPAAAVFASDQSPGPKAFGDHLAMAFERWVEQLEDRGTPFVLDAWRASAWRLGEKLTIGSGPGAVSGVFRDIDAVGRIILRLPSGEDRVFSAGDASHR